MTAVIIIPWIAAALVEAIGSFTSWRFNKILSMMFGFLCLVDVCSMPLHGNSLAWAFWAQRVGKYLFLVLIGCELCGMFTTQPKREARIMSALIAMGSASIVMVFFCQGETLKNRLLDGELSANMILFVIIFLGWLGSSKKLDRHWSWVAAGFLVLIGWDVTVTILWKFFWTARHWYPLGTLAAYVIWIVGPLLSLREARTGLGVRTPECEKVVIQ